MVVRHFLGWDRPFLTALVEWLLARREELPALRLVVPTAQSGRRLREALAERGGCLAPRVVTPGWFLQTESAAPEMVELLAWSEVLEGIRDWSEWESVFPVPPGEGEGPGWSMGLARSLAGLATSLLENGLTMAGASRVLGQTVEGERWMALRALEGKVASRLAEWGWSMRGQQVETKVRTGLAERIVLAGVTDLPGAVGRILSLSKQVECLIGAPPSLEKAFDEMGRPEVEFWKRRELAWPVVGRGSVTLTADPGQQAEAALRKVAEAGTASNALTLGSADEETADELVRVFGRSGWVLHDPSRPMPIPLRAWLAMWRAYVRQPDAASAVDLLGCEETSILVRGRRAQRVRAISRMRDQWMIRTREDLVRVVEEITRDEEEARLALETLEMLEALRGQFLREPFHVAMERLLRRVNPDGKAIEVLLDPLAQTAEVADRVERDHGFWLDLLMVGFPEVSATPAEDRVLDVQGWLELFHEEAPHLVICGLNEGKVPGRASTDSWLPEGARRVLGLSHDATRAARDVYLLEAMLEARRTEGRVDLLLAKSSAKGDALLPSRLLLAANERELPQRVRQLFEELEPPDSGLAWTLEDVWKWKPRGMVPKPRISVTAFSDYLACPFRFYLKHVVGMNQADAERVEWNARDFGNMAHVILERWAKDEEARDESNREAIERWVHAALERVVQERFGDRPPLAVRIQAESLRQRLSWFAQVQAEERKSGWRIEEVERKFEVELAGYTVVGRVDRIERHEDGRRRVLDYKTTGKADEVEKKHRLSVTAATRLPAHLENVPEVRCSSASGKPMRWRNLQVPLYTLALGQVDELGYFALGATEGDVRISLWEGFSRADEHSARACAEWIICRIKEGRFWPPAERVEYDDYEVLSLGRLLEETVDWGGVA